MKGTIITQFGPKGAIQVVDGEFKWEYNDDELAVKNILVQADDLEHTYYEGDYELDDGETAREQLKEAPPEKKYAWVKAEFKGMGEVWEVLEGDPDHKS